MFIDNLRGFLSFVLRDLSLTAGGHGHGIVAQCVLVSSLTAVGDVASVRGVLLWRNRSWHGSVVAVRSGGQRGDVHFSRFLLRRSLAWIC